MKTKILGREIRDVRSWKWTSLRRPNARSMLNGDVQEEKRKGRAIRTADEDITK